MNFQLRKLTISDNMDIYEMLQEIPKDENGFINTVNGTILLKMIIEETRKMNLEKVLITVRNRNSNSIKVALNNNGKIEKVSKERHYIWIDC
jgi:glutamine amidotransferase PdxT